ncbi:MAG: Jag N-terminal domain-containing protein, partial [Ardenticatenaceae bacterium]|nr:Jag N-terminal domain-containing protein [Ardenticatenaceae bacterium]
MSNKREIEARGADVEKAIEAGLQKLGVSRSEVIIDVVDEGSRGLLGIGSREAVVRLTALSAPTPPPPAPKPAPKPVPQQTAVPTPKPAPKPAPKREPRTNGSDAEVVDADP